MARNEGTAFGVLEDPMSRWVVARVARASRQKVHDHESSEKKRKVTRDEYRKETGLR